MSKNLCQICQTKEFKYTCPKCNILYCSGNCYRANSHLDCSEKFYKQCIQEELASQAVTSKKTDETHKILEILQRVSNEEPIIDENLFTNNDIEDIDEIDSDDEIEPEDLEKRLEGININDADELWKTLTKEEQLQFEFLIENGEVEKFVPTFEPWWEKQIETKRITEIDYKEEDDLKTLIYPAIKRNILDFDKIIKKSPHPSVKYNLCNILGAYSCTVRFFVDDHLLNSVEAANYIWMISNVLNQNANFNNDEEAIKSIIMIGQSQNLGMDLNDYIIIQNDVKNIVAGPFKNHSSDIYKLSALSDIQQIFRNAKRKIFEKKEKGLDTFSKKFANCMINTELNIDKISQLIKKVDFFLSYVKNKKYVENELLL